MISGIALIWDISGVLLFSSHFEYYLSLKPQLKITRKNHLKLKINLRFRDGGNYYRKYYIGMDRKISRHISTSLFLGLKESGTTGWQEKVFLWPQVTVRENLNRFNISSRSRLEYHFYDTDLKYRNRVKVRYKWKRFMSIWAGDELSYSFKENEIFENECLSGITISFNKSFSCDIFYDFRQIKKENSWERAHILRTSLNFSF